MTLQMQKELQKMLELSESYSNARRVVEDIEQNAEKLFESFFKNYANPMNKRLSAVLDKVAASPNLLMSGHCRPNKWGFSNVYSDGHWSFGGEKRNLDNCYLEHVMTLDRFAEKGQGWLNAQRDAAAFNNVDSVIVDNLEGRYILVFTDSRGYEEYYFAVKEGDLHLFAEQMNLTVAEFKQFSLPLKFSPPDYW